jgi:proteasome lid subunit RPN8/RPN11
MLTIRQDIVDLIITHARVDHPGTACGLVAGPSGSDRPERFIPMRNAADSPTFWEFDTAEQWRVWKAMDERDEEPVVIYYSQNQPGAYPSKTTIAFAQEPAHYVIVSTFGPEEAEFRSFQIADGRAVEEEIRVVGSRGPGPRA